MPDPASPVDPRLAELLRQRDLVAQHLAWLDSAIARGSGEFPATPPALPPPVPAFRPPAPPPVQAPPSPDFPPSAPLAPPPAASRPVPDISSILEAPSGIDPREKFGCIAILVAVALLILGSIFILPYLLPQFR